MPTLREGMPRAERPAAAVIDFIHANPVRRGLVEQPTDWEWSSARFWEGGAERAHSYGCPVHLSSDISSVPPAAACASPRTT
jgi:hypothetical protein